MTECQARDQSQVHVWQAFLWRGSASSPLRRKAAQREAQMREWVVRHPGCRLCPGLTSGPGWAAPAGNLPPSHWPLPCATLSDKPPEPPGANTEPPAPDPICSWGAHGPARGLPGETLRMRLKQGRTPWTVHSRGLGRGAGESGWGHSPQRLLRHPAWCQGHGRRSS